MGYRAWWTRCVIAAMSLNWVGAQAIPIRPEVSRVGVAPLPARAPAATESASPAVVIALSPIDDSPAPLNFNFNDPTAASPAPKAPAAADGFSLYPQTPAAVVQPILADNTDDQGDVYTLPNPPAPGEGTNQGGVNIDLTLSYFNHYIYRGVDHSITASTGTPNTEHSKGTTLNLQPDIKLSFDLGHLPHPFIGLFSNVYDADPKSRFQEIRPYYGATWDIRPFTLEGGGITYIYPEREGRDTAEVYGKITFDDSFLFNSDKPILSPYIYGAYDYDKNHGWYIEAGLSHDVDFEDLGLVLTFSGDVAYIIGFQQQFVFTDSLHDTGFQHYDVGLQGAYSLNRVFNISNRYGKIDLMGYLYYTGKIENELRADDVLWGGAGIRFEY